MKGSKMIKLEFTLDELNGLLNALAQLPFIQAVQFINTIQMQATPQVLALQKEEKNDESEAAS